MMTTNTREYMEGVVKTYYDGRNEADVNKLESCLAADAVHYFPAGAPQGTFVGAHAIAEGWQRAVATTGSMWTIDSLLVDEERAEVSIEWTHWKTKLGIHLRGVEQYRFDNDGRIAEIRAFYAAPAADLQVHELGGFDYAGRGYALTPPLIRRTEGGTDAATLNSPRSPELAPSTGQRVELTWLGQSGFLFHNGHGGSVLIDPFLSPHQLRRYPPPNLDVLGDDVRWLVATHQHGDHLDLDVLPRLVERFPGMQVALPAPVASLVKGIVKNSHVHPLQPGDLLRGDGVHIRAVPACHGVSVADGYSNGRKRPGDLTPFLGYVLDFGAVAFYHAGDTIINDELLKSLKGCRVDVALLPVNGRDFFRESEGIVGNLTVEEAVRLASRIGASTLVPCHYDMIRGNLARPGSAADAAHDLEAPVHVLTLTRLLPYRF